MKAFIISTIVVLVRRLADRQTWVQIETLVAEAEEMHTLSGEQKRNWVLMHSADAVGWLVNLVIEVLVAQKRV